MLIAAVLLLSPGCVKQPDWIESTLVTVDVTGVWHGQASGMSGIPTGTSAGRLTSHDITLTLEQEGPRVKGSFMLGTPGRYSGPLEGRVGGDVLHFTVVGGTREVFRGELTVSGDEMEGAFGGADVHNARIVVRRVDSSSRPTSERP